jgi:tetratricopeptide (TPR) repeat protein
VRITVQLINAMDGYHLWSERYDRDMQDIFEVQDEITLAVVDALKVKLLGAEKKAVLKRHTNNAEAYQLYLRGRYFFYKRTPEGFLKAIECFKNAIELDPNYAVAISGLADSYAFLGFYEVEPPGGMAVKVGPLATARWRLTTPSQKQTHHSPCSKHCMNRITRRRSNTLIGL